MNSDDVLVGLALVPLAAATIVVSNSIALRDRRDSAHEIFEACPTPASTRRLGYLGAVLGSTVIALVATAALVSIARARGGVGAPNVYELLNASALVCAAGTMGLVLARFVPAATAASASVALLLSLHVYSNAAVTDTFGPPSRLRWLLPWVALSPTGTPAPELVVRTPGWHLVYLVAAVVAGGGLVALRKPATVASVVAVVLGTALLAAAAVAQTRPLGPAQLDTLTDKVTAPERFLECSTRSGIRFCSYPAYQPWVDAWHEAIQPVVEHAPDGAADGLNVVQVPLAYGSDVPSRVQELLANRWRPGGRDRMRTSYDPRSIYTTTQLPSGGEWVAYRAALAAGAASDAVGLPISPTGLAGAERDSEEIASLAVGDQDVVRRLARTGDFEACTPAGQARAVVALWLVGASAPEVEELLREWVTPGTELEAEAGTFSRNGVASLDSIGAVDVQPTGSAVAWPLREAEIAVTLLDQPISDTAARVRANWMELTDPRTSTDAGAALLGVSAGAGAYRAVDYDAAAVIPCR